MVSKPTAKFIKSLQLKKYRKEMQSFLVEGGKSVQEVLSADFEVTHLVATSDFIATHHKALQQVGEVLEEKSAQLAKLGTFKTNDSALAVVKMKPVNHIPVIQEEYALVLDNINDPGNLGAIIRIADWYGIQHIIASPDTADFYNSKTIAASKGSFCRVNMCYTELEIWLSTNKLPVFGAEMTGGNVHHTHFPEVGLIILGNEANGISANVSQYINHHITIPRYGMAESLNVAMAAAVICDNVRRDITPV